MLLGVGGAIFTVRDMLAGSSVLPLLQGLLVAALLAGAVFLWRVRDLPLGRLRVLECLVFGSVAAYVAFQEYYLISQDALAGNDGLVLSRLVRVVLLFALLAAAYGVFIPNSWQRAAMMVVPLGAVPLVLAGVLVFQHSEVALAVAQTGFASQIYDSLLLLGLGVAMAIYGTHVLNGYFQLLFDSRYQELYTLKERIGEGGMGEVWIAMHRVLARPTAMKLIRPDRLGGGSEQDARHAIRRFEREAQATASLSSAHTVEVYDFGVTGDGTFFYVMEYLHGLDLEELVRRHGPLPAERVVHFMRQACDSLSDAHSRGLIHRDIKPGNLYICRMGIQYDFLKVLDFGLVKMEQSASSGRLTVEGLTTGTPAYMAPELAVDAEKADARADLYALGGVGYWLLTGQLVFDQQSPLAMVADHVKTPPVPPSKRTEVEIPEAMDRIILKCLAKDPADRFQTAAELDEALAALSFPNGWSARRAEEWWRLHMPDLVAPAAESAGVLRPAYG